MSTTEDTQRRYLRARSNRDLTNAELDRRMRMVPVKGASSMANSVVPGVSELTNLWDSERKFRISRGSTRDEARETQRLGQHQRAGQVVATGGLGVAGAQVKDVASSLARGKLPKSRKLRGGLAAAAVGAGYAGYRGKQRTALETKVWRRMLAEKPNEKG